MPLDIGVGLMLGTYLSNISPIAFGWCLVIGVAACLLPDLDFVWSLARSKNGIVDTRHRDKLHYPLLYIPIVGLLGLLLSSEVALILILGALLHFIHDSIGVGFGLKWLYPFKKNSYLFFFQTSTPRNKNMPKPEKFVYSWTDKQRDEMIRKYAYVGWIKYIYFRLHPYGMFEYAVLVFGIIVAVVLA